jgi:hypothetical protein
MLPPLGKKLSHILLHRDANIRPVLQALTSAFEAEMPAKFGLTQVEWI